MGLRPSEAMKINGVTPAKAGVHFSAHWIPAFAGMTRLSAGRLFSVLENSRNNPGMSMKRKHKVKMSRSSHGSAAQRGNENQRRHPREGGGPFFSPMDSRFRGNDATFIRGIVFSSRKLEEQSGNVYENKQ